MKRLAFENALRSTLAAWMLLAAIVSSSTFIHSHSDGGIAHQHDRSECIALGLSDSSGSGTDRGVHHGWMSLSRTDSHQHRSLLPWGNVIYVPTSGEPAVPDGKSPCGWCYWIATVSAAQLARTASENRSADPIGPISGLMVSTDRLYDSLRCGIPRAGIVLAAPLCDRARHERSGVQLA